MGSLPRLKIKDEIKYRKGSTNESVNCVSCSRQVLADNGEPRCTLIGLNPGARYRIRTDHRCDRHEMSQSWRDRLERMMRHSQ